MLHMGHCACDILAQFASHFPRIFARRETHDDCSTAQEPDWSGEQSDQVGSDQGDFHGLQILSVLPTGLLCEYRERGHITLLCWYAMLIPCVAEWRYLQCEQNSNQARRIDSPC